MAKSSDQEKARLQEENVRLHKLLTSLEAQLKESNLRGKELSKQLTAALDGNKELAKQLKDLQQKLDILIARMKKRNQRDYGPKTEKHNPQRALDQAPARKPPANEPATIEDGTSRKHIRKHKLTPEPVPHLLSEAQSLCPHCLTQTAFVGNKLSYQLDKVLQSLRYLEHQQEVRACQNCKQYMVTAEKPESAFGQYTPTLRSFILVDRFGDGLPHNRQEKRFDRESATIPRSTQSDCSIDSAFTITPLYELLCREMRKAKVIKTDDSEIKIQDRKLKGRMRKGKMTTYVTEKLTAFDFSPDLSFAKNKEWFEEFRGYVQADAARGFDAIYKTGFTIEVGCNAHSRRGYYECLPVEPKLCNAVLDIYDDIYKVEGEVRGKPPGIILAARRRRLKPLFKKLRKKLLAILQRDDLSPAHPLIKAVNYTLNHWIALTRFLKDPDLDIDNNAAERAIKDFVLMRKNSLFVGSDAGGKAAAIHLSFIASCKRNKINPVAYFTDVFTRINSMKLSELEQLLPDRWKPAEKAAC